MTDIITRINEWLEAGEQDDADRTLRDARDEIVSLRAMLTREQQAINTLIRELGKWSNMAGFFMGGMDHIEHGRFDPAEVAKACREKYEKAAQ